MSISPSPTSDHARPSAFALLRRRRADEQLRRDYGALKRRVVARARGSLERRGVHLDDADLDAAYNQAWHGLHGQLTEGTAVANATGFLVTATIRRALDEYRRLHVDRRAEDPAIEEHGADPDIEARLDDGDRLRHFVEGLKDSLSERERQAAALCYLHGLSRPEAARALGVEPKRMEKIMDAVSRKIGPLVEAIEQGLWCESRGSLMRAYAFGVLDLRGERHALATEHLAACVGCRAYVRSLRGVGAVVPPVLLPFGAPAAAGASVVVAGAGAGPTIGAKVAAGLAAAACGAGVVAAGGPSGAVADTPPAAAAVSPAPRPAAVAPAPRVVVREPAKPRVHKARAVHRRPKRAPRAVATPTPTPTPATPAPTPAPAPAPAPAPRAAPPTEFGFERP